MSFDKTLLREPKRRKEKITLDAGTAWVWEETVAEHFQKLTYSERPPIDPRGGVDMTAALTWQILLSLYDSDQPDAQRIFGEDEMALIYRFRREEYDRILAALAKVNGQSDQEAADWEAFTEASEAAQTSR